MCAQREIRTWQEGYRVARLGVLRDYYMGDISRAEYDNECAHLERDEARLRHARHTRAVRLWLERQKGRAT
jgi:hypothetical protein